MAKQVVIKAADDGGVAEAPKGGTPSRSVETVQRERTELTLKVGLLKDLTRKGHAATPQRKRVDVDFMPDDAETLTQLGQALIADGVIDPGYQRDRPETAAVRWLVKRLTEQRVGK